MSAQWDGKTRGTIFGFKVFIFFIRNFGINAAYMLMHLPVPYFCLFEFKNSSGLYYYFRKRRRQGIIKSIFNVYRTYFEFGKSIIDRVAISSGLRDNYSFEFDGEDNIKNVLDQQKGGILISAHVGNFEMAQYFFRERLPNAKISIVITDQDHENIKDYLQKYLKKEREQFIIVKDDLSHIFEINAALSQNRIVCISGDRYLPGTKTMEESLLGKKAKFPVGPFHLASKLDVPILFVYVMREPRKHYHLFARKVKKDNDGPKELLIKYTDNVEKVLNKYPLQWFNLYDFWEDRTN